MKLTELQQKAAAISSEWHKNVGIIGQLRIIADNTQDREWSARFVRHTIEVLKHEHVRAARLTPAPSWPNVHRTHVQFAFLYRDALREGITLD